MKQEPDDRPYDSYQAVVQATWKHGIIQQPLVVWGGRGDEIPEKVAGGQATLAPCGGPLTAYATGFRLHNDWDKLHTGLGPGEWVCTAEPVSDPDTQE